MSINNSLLKSIQTIVDGAVSIAPFDKTRQAQIIANNNDGTYGVRLDGVIYYNVPSYPVTDLITVGSIVKVVIPNNQSNKMFIQLSTSVVDATIPMLNLNDYKVDGSIDKEIYDGLWALGWGDVVGAYVDVNLALHGSWIDSGTLIDGYKVFKSNSSYNVNNAWDTAKISFSGYKSFTIYIRSYAESTYDYVLVSTLDNDYLASRTTTSAMRSAYSNTEYTKAYTRGAQSASDYTAVTFDNLNPEQDYYFYVIYQKDNSTNSNDDRGYFYLPYQIKVV